MFQKARRCINCGHEWAVEPSVRVSEDELIPVDRCPVCFYQVSLEEAPKKVDMEDDTNELNFGERLNTLVLAARSSGLSTGTIVEALRDELAFVAELSRPGHRYYVQVVDLGPDEGVRVPQPAQDTRAVLQHRKGIQ
jgi:hypothetical protein